MSHPDLDLSRLRDRLALDPAKHPHRPGDRHASVLLGLLGDPVAILGIIRQHDGRVHGGQFSLPGGIQEEGETDWECALRETREEIGPFDECTWLGTLGEFNTAVSRYRVHVHVAHLPHPPRWDPDSREVAGVVKVPVADLLSHHRELPRGCDPWELPILSGFDVDLDPHLVAGEVLPKGRGHQVKIRGVVHETPYIWGLTARIIYDFLERIW